MTNLYETLGVHPKADTAAIRKAFRKKAKTEHPDAGGSAERFGAISLAHDVLTDETRRRKYDETGSTDAPNRHDPIEDAALKMLDQLVSDWLSDEKAKHKDPVKFISAKLLDARIEAEKYIAEGQSHETRLKDLIARLVKRPKRDFIGNMLRQRLEQTVNAIRTGEERRKAIEHAESLIVDGYEFRREKTQQEIEAELMQSAPNMHFYVDPYSSVFGRGWR